MGLFDNLLLSDDIELLGYHHGSPRYDDDGSTILWQTKSLTCGQDRYRLRPIIRDGEYYVSDHHTGTYQLERRVPPLQKMTDDGTQILTDEPAAELQWWNIVRPTVKLRFYRFDGRTRYEYKVDLINGVTDGDIEVVKIDHEYWDEDGGRRTNSNPWGWFIDETTDPPTVYQTDITVSEIVQALGREGPMTGYEEWNLDAGEVHKALMYYRAHESEFTEVDVEDSRILEYLRKLVERKNQ